MRRKTGPVKVADVARMPSTAPWYARFNAALAGFVVVAQSLGARELLGIGLVVVASLGASWPTRGGSVPLTGSRR